ncbi:hypothetical protein LEP1GSC047_3275 [Leptospira inadai serovar Lyme str. 10]|uniref:Uncharacterized protein n=2 Tax=Leptospira inadai serovar Lyme TaxID=293084 RepID=V6HIW8_9LEPT|nr:hypothetical protein [Leptospira inadai]EQA36725.1 hypothetical protein LEP1GSC047_3275 [Leptospira inadai serovar Lyme str. 10]PNV74548.1 hypothetical protein BES34_013500 [Leptospira inadai serovar Lyme]
MNVFRRIRPLFYGFLPIFLFNFSFFYFSQAQISVSSHPDGQYKSAYSKFSPFKKAFRLFQDEEEDDGINSVWMPDSSEYDSENTNSEFQSFRVPSRIEFESTVDSSYYLLSDLLLNIPPPSKT